TPPRHPSRKVASPMRPGTPIRISLALSFVALASSRALPSPQEPKPKPADAPPAFSEPCLKNLTQLSTEGDNGEPYWAPDGKQIIFQSKRGSLEFDQIFVMHVDGSMLRMVSTGRGRCTCSYFAPDGKKIIYASTHLREGPPPEKPKTAGYDWSFDPAF